jgi:sirohydrochlorin ferrochelatase
VFTTLLRLNDDEQVVNLAHARWRTAQYVRAYVDPAYQVEPPFTEDETGGLEP